MAHVPRSGGAPRGVIKPPNEAGPCGNRAHNSYLPLAAEAGPRLDGDHGGGDRRRGCVPLGGMPSPVRPPSQRFDVGDAEMPQPPSAVDPGKGAIPVNPSDCTNRPGLVAFDFGRPKAPPR